jgi:fatty acid desaturase
MTTMPSPAVHEEQAPAASSRRDYSLTGPAARRAIEAGLATADWYHTDVPRKVMKELIQRRDGPAVRDTIIWIMLHILTAAGGIYFWGTLWCVPFWLAYGVLYGSACDSRWHEAGHGTAFRTRWMNDVVYHIASFQVMRNPVPGGGATRATIPTRSLSAVTPRLPGCCRRIC